MWQTPAGSIEFLILSCISQTFDTSYEKTKTFRWVRLVDQFCWVGERSLLIMADFVPIPVQFGSSKADHKNIKTSSRFHEGRVYRWHRRSKNAKAEYWVCNLCRKLKEKDNLPNRVSLYKSCSFHLCSQSNMSLMNRHLDCYWHKIGYIRVNFKNFEKSFAVMNSGYQTTTCFVFSS